MVTDPRRTRLTTTLELVGLFIPLAARLLAGVGILASAILRDPYWLAATGIYTLAYTIEDLAKPEPRRLNPTTPATSSPTSSPPLPKTPPG